MSGTIDKKLAAVCGLFCPACSIYIGTTEEPARLEAMARRMNYRAEELQCHGCRAEKRCFYCDSLCMMSKCAAGKGLDFCGQCPEYPCEDLKVFQAERPHRIELWRSQERIRAVGYETWYAEMLEHFSCPKCRTINSAYDLKCRKCGEEPGCAYVGLHRKEILRHLEKMK